MTLEQKKYEFYVDKIVDAGGQTGKERIKPSDPQAKAVIEKHKTCAICPISYLDKPDIFEIHHIDGQADNTHTKNLALICSNCHKQVHTEASRILKDLQFTDSYCIRPFLNTSKIDIKRTTSSNQYEMAECAYCRGTGKANPFWNTVCPVCKGAGQNKIKKSAIDCAFCNGTGKENPFWDTVCPACKGTGFK